MIDLRVIEVRALLPVVSVSPLPDMVPRTLQLFGPDLSSVSEVWMNEQVSPSILVRSSTHILAQVPDSIGGKPVRTISAISHKVSTSARSKITFSFGTSPKYISGSERLVQCFLKLLLQSPGTDRFNPFLGGGILRAVGQMGQRAGAATLVADVQSAVDRARGQLLSLQAQESNLSVEEKLLYARLLKAEFNQQEGALFCSIDLANQAMQSSLVSLEV